MDQYYVYISILYAKVSTRLGQPPMSERGSGDEGDKKRRDSLEISSHPLLLVPLHSLEPSSDDHQK